MAPVILVTFAGRQKRMGVLTQYVRRALDLGVIDQWHIWDFTRSSEDHAWVTREFGPVRFMGSKAPYQEAGSITRLSPFRARVGITNDLHIGVLPNDDQEHFYEFVIGGWNNQASALRKSPREQLGHLDRKDVQNLWSRVTPGILSPGTDNSVVMCLADDGALELSVNDVPVGRWPDLVGLAGARVMIRGGWGGDLELCDTNAPIQRYVGNPNEQMPYWQAYHYYAKRLTQFADTLFLKCDDDIVYLDIDRLSDFIEFRRRNPHYFVVSANVVNNGVCAYLQQQAGHLPEGDLGEFEYPPGGFGGSLWQSGERAIKLHEFFLQSQTKHFPLSAGTVEWNERQSINFIAWLGRDILHMALAQGDDERVMTVDLPAYLGRPCAIYSDFTVSHLSFGPQERGFDFDPLVDRYEDLMREKLGL